MLVKSPVHGELSVVLSLWKNCVAKPHLPSKHRLVHKARIFLLVDLQDFFQI